MTMCKPCLVQVKFYSDDGFDAEKVRICGLINPIESSSGGYLRDVFYPRNPNEHVPTINRIDFELARNLVKFDIIIVQTKREYRFLKFFRSYVFRCLPLIVLQPTLEAARQINESTIESTKRVDSSFFLIKRRMRDGHPTPYLMATAKKVCDNNEYDTN